MRTTILAHIESIEGLIGKRGSAMPSHAETLASLHKLLEYYPENMFGAGSLTPVPEAKPVAKPTPKPKKGKK